VVKAGDVSNSRLARKFLELGVRVRELGRGGKEGSSIISEDNGLIE
jgi:hypothetical protein